MNKSYYNWYKLDFESKKNYSIQAESDENILEIAQNYKYINSFMVFIYHYLKSNNFTKENFPTIYMKIDKLKYYLTNKSYLFTKI